MALESCDSARSFERVIRIYVSYESESAMDTLGENRSTHLPRRRLSDNELLRRIVLNQFVDQTGRFPSPAAAHDECPESLCLMTSITSGDVSKGNSAFVLFVRKLSVTSFVTSKNLSVIGCQVSTETLRRVSCELTIFFETSPVVHQDRWGGIDGSSPWVYLHAAQISRMVNS